MLSAQIKESIYFFLSGIGESNTGSSAISCTEVLSKASACGAPHTWQETFCKVRIEGKMNILTILSWENTFHLSTYIIRLNYYLPKKGVTTGWILICDCKYAQ